MRRFPMHMCATDVSQHGVVRISCDTRLIWNPNLANCTGQTIKCQSGCRVAPDIRIRPGNIAEKIFLG